MAKPKVKARNDTLFGVCIQIHHEIVHVKTLFEERCWERGEREIYRYTDATARAAVCEAVVCETAFLVGWMAVSLSIYTPCSIYRV